MRKIRIAVLDTGFDFYRQLRNPIAYSACFLDKAQPFDQHGHGSCIITLLDSIGTNLEFYNMTVLNQKKIGKLSFLKNALRTAIELDVDIINLSLGIENSVTDSELESFLKTCDEKKIILVTTSSNLGKNNYLMSYDNIISIQRKDNVSKSFLLPKLGAFFVENTPRILPWLNGTYKLSGANSFLTPLLIKKLYQINEEVQNLEDSFKLLLKLSASDILSRNNNDCNIQRELPIDQSLCEQIRLRLKSNTSKLYDEHNQLILSNATNVNITGLVNLIEDITNRAYIYDSLWLQDIMFVENLSNRLLLMRER